MPSPKHELIIAPSLLAANYSRLDREVQRLNRSGAEWIHLDIMDGHFVPNLSFGPETLKSIRPLTGLFVDVHLMCARPDILIEPFVKAGANSITIHAELDSQTTDLLWQIRNCGVKVGLAVNPPTSIETVLPHLEAIDLLLIMTVNPGFGGQSFIPEVLPKIEFAAKHREKSGLNYRIEVDGGINPSTGSQCVQAGADTLVSGSALFRKTNLKSAVSHLRACCDARLMALPIPE